MNVLRLLPNKLKVWALKNLYMDISSMGDGGDTTLAHVNPDEVALLKASGGSGTINARTGLVEFKGGGGSSSPPPPVDQKSVTTNIPEYAQPYYEELLKQAGKQTYATNASGRVTGTKAYVPYEGERIAGFTDEQLALQGQVGGLQAPTGFGTAQTGLQQGTNLGFGTAQTGIANAMNYTPGSTANLGVSTPTTFGAQQAAQYMNPYQQNVTDVQLTEARRQADITRNKQALGSIGRGTFGGGRQALMAGEADRNLAIELGKIQATGSQAGYADAQKQFERDRTAGMAAEQQNLQADMDQRKLGQQAEQFAIGQQKDLGLAGLATGMSGSEQIGAMSAREQTANLERLRAQASTAAEQQALQQEIDNMAYQVFQEEQDYGRKMIQFQSDILRGNAGALGSTVTQYAAAPSLAGQIVGLGAQGLGALGMAGAFK
jgi:hypothetical protein